MKIAIGGMIASGKTTLGKSLGKDLNLEFITEFYHNDEMFNKMLEWLYQKREDSELILQTYFISHSYKKAQNNNCIVDRDIIEHKMFADINLFGKYDNKVWSNYNALFYSFYANHIVPKHYLIIDITWEEFTKNLFHRNRKVEIENFSQNEEYFKKLQKQYTRKLKAYCDVFNIKYTVIEPFILENKEKYTKLVCDLKKIIGSKND